MLYLATKNVQIITILKSFTGKKTQIRNKTLLPQKLI